MATVNDPPPMDDLAAEPNQILTVVTMKDALDSGVFDIDDLTKAIIIDELESWETAK